MNGKWFEGANEFVYLGNKVKKETPNVTLEVFQ
jgi:hypothetical protein